MGTSDEPGLRRHKLRGIFLACLIAVACAFLFLFVGWYRGYRNWHNSKAAPLFANIEPADGATVYASDAWIRWTSPIKSTGRVLWRKAGSSKANSADAGTSEGPLAHLGSLNAGSKYEYIVEENSGTQTLRSSVRTLNVISGLSFDPVIDQTVDRDYDQTVKLTLRNRGSQTIKVAARALKQYEDLPSDITGYGSVEVPATIASNSTQDLRLAVTAADAISDTYDIPIEAAGAYVVAKFHVRRPKLNLAFRVLSEDPKTLAKMIEIQNNGDTLSDLIVGPAHENKGDVTLEPSINHLKIYEHEGIRFTATPVLYLEFESLHAQIEARAAGQTAKFPIDFKAPPGMHLIAFRSASWWNSSVGGGYCTNKPNTCSDASGPPGNGPALIDAAATTPAESECGQTKCDTKNACKDVKKLQELMAKYSSSSETAYFGSFQKFTQEFDPILGRLTNSDLACAFDNPPKINPNVAPLLRGIHHDRFGFQTLNDTAQFPSNSDCQYETDRNPNLPPSEWEVPTPQEARRCADYHRAKDISSKLDQLAGALGCDNGGEPAGEGPCPSTEGLKTIKEQAEKAVNVTNWLQEQAQKLGTDPQMEEGFEQTAKNFEEVVKLLEPALKFGEKCEKLADLLNKLQDFEEAITEIDNAGCNSLAMEQGFDHLFRAAGALGQQVLPIPELQPIFQAIAQDQNFFQNVGGGLNPEQRWARQFAQTDGYIFTCHP